MIRGSHADGHQNAKQIVGSRGGVGGRPVCHLLQRNHHAQIVYRNSPGGHPLLQLLHDCTWQHLCMDNVLNFLFRDGQRRMPPEPIVFSKQQSARFQKRVNNGGAPFTPITGHVQGAAFQEHGRIRPPDRRSVIFTRGGQLTVASEHIPEKTNCSNAVGTRMVKVGNQYTPRGTQPQVKHHARLLSQIDPPGTAIDRREFAITFDNGDRRLVVFQQSPFRPPSRVVDHSTQQRVVEQRFSQSILER